MDAMTGSDKKTVPAKSINGPYHSQQWGVSFKRINEGGHLYNTP